MMRPFLKYLWLLSAASSSLLAVLLFENLPKSSAESLTESQEQATDAGLFPTPFSYASDTISYGKRTILLSGTSKLDVPSLSIAGFPEHEVSL
jgi:hypothetical protein